VAPFGIFLSIELPIKKLVEGFVHISEVSWKELWTIPETFKAGEKIEVEVINFDKESQRVNLSIKKLIKDPFEEKLKSYAVDQRVSGSVTKVLSNGVLVNVREGIEDLLRKIKFRQIFPTMMVLL